MNKTGKQLRDEGIKQSTQTADSVYPNWTEEAYEFLVEYALEHKKFMVEDVRLASNGTIPIPPSKRAWGGVVVKAAKSGLIEREGFRHVKNEKAHRTPATYWRLTEQNNQIEKTILKISPIKRVLTKIEKYLNKIL